MAKTAWRISGEEIASCNCAWGCPCQFNALPTTGRCEAFAAWSIDKGHFGDTPLDGLVFASVLWFPGPVHEGNGKALHVIDEKANPAQRAALAALLSGDQGGVAFEIFSAVTPIKLGIVSAPITFESQRDARMGRVRIPGVGETTIEPIKNPVTGETHRARIDLPDGFEYKLAEVGNTVACTVSAAGVSFDLSNTYAQLNHFDWTSGV